MRNDRVLLGSLTVKKTFGFADLTSVTGVFDRVADRQEDGTYFNSTAFALFFLDPIFPDYQAQNDSVIANLPSYVHYRTRYQQFSQELRLSGDFGDAVTWMVGANLSGKQSDFFTILDGRTTSATNLAPSPTGNVASEDVVYLLQGLGLDSGVDLPALAETGRWLAGLLGRATASRTGQALAAAG